MVKIIEICRENFTEALPRIQNCLCTSSMVAMDTEFPGTITKPFLGFIKSKNKYFQILRRNVDLLQLIQLGISFADEKGGKITIKECLQFNFNFNLSQNMFAQDSIDLLLRSGVDFQNHKKKGVMLEKFVEMLKFSRLIFNENIYWISFHSGYDFGYLLKILTNESLPKNRTEFLKLIEIYFPHFYDVKNYNKPEINQEDIIEIMYTSGTTGDPKGVILTHLNLITNINGLSNILPSFKKDNVFLSILPLSHIFEQTVGLFITSHLHSHIIFAHKPSSIVYFIKVYKIK